MTGRLRTPSGLALVMLAMLLGGCAVSVPPPVVIEPRPALFTPPASAGVPKTAGRVVVWVAPDAQAGKTEVYPRMLLATGPMVEQALLRALDDGLLGGATRVAELPPPGSGFGATLQLRWVHLELRTYTLPPRTVALDFELALSDGAGRRVWSRTYHDDRDYAFGERLALTSMGETAFDSEIRQAHEAVWRLAQQVLRDVRAWLEAERLRPREL